MTFSLSPPQTLFRTSNLRHSTMDCIKRQHLLELLSPAVAAHHPRASRALADYIARPLTDDELEQFVTTLILTKQKKHARQATQAELLQRIDRAKTQYATYLRAMNKRDIRVQWLSSKDLQSFGPTYQRQHWLHVQEVFSHRYEEPTKEFDEVKGKWHTGFSIVVSCAELEKLSEITNGWPVHFKDNVDPTYAPPSTRKPPLMRDIWKGLAQSLERTHASRFEFVPTPLERGDDHWFPFPTFHFTARERMFNAYRGATIKELDLWERGHPKHILLRGCARAGQTDRTVLGASAPAENGEAVVVRESLAADGPLAARMEEEDPQIADFFSGKFAGHKCLQMPGMSGIPPEQPAVTGRYDKAARVQPPAECRIMAGSESDEGSGSVAVASLSTVSGNLKRMKSFVRKPSRGEALAPSTEETETLQPQEEQVPGEPLAILPSSSPMSLLSAQFASSQTHMETPQTPPDSISPANPPPLETSRMQFRRRVPSAADKAKPKRTTPRRPGLKATKSQDSTLSNASTTATRTESSSSLEPLTNTSTAETKLSVSCGDSPSPTNLWSQPADASEKQSGARRKDSGLGTFSPGRRATTSIQRIDARGQRSSCAVSQFSDCSNLSSQKPRGRSIDNRKDSCFSAPMGHQPSAAQHALIAASSPK
ncbi:hypothetical protein HDK64DRAFT_315355 [Phyllosticta capitalensis]